MVACDDPCTAPVGPATPVMKGTSHLVRSRRVWTRSRCWLVALSIVLIAASSACVFAGAVNDVDVGTADGSIVVGKETYRTPFTQYPPLVADTLQSRPVYYSSKSGDEGNQDPDVMIAEADWLLFLGMAHRRTLEEKVELTEVDFQQILMSANALQQGIALMEQLREQYPDERLTAGLRLAELYVNLGETYHLSVNDDQYKMAMDYFVRAEDIYRQTLESDEYIPWASDDGSDEGASRVEVEIRWAHCCHRIGVALLAMARDIAHTMDLDASLLTDPETIQAVLASAKAKLETNALMAETHLRKAVTIFSKISKGGYKNTESKDYQMDEVDIDRHLASALSSLGTAVGMTGDLEAGIEYSEQALEIYQKLYPRLPQGDHVKEEAMMDISDMLYTLAEQHLQLGKYDGAKQHYSKAMEWYSENNIAPPEHGAFDQGVTELDDAIAEYEAQLEAYNVLNNQGMDIGVSDYEDEIYMGKDELYEGDIHMSLGSLFLAKGDLVSAGSHLSQSIKLYEISGEEEDRNLADAKFNMSVLKYQTGDYALSREFYDSALDIYRDVVGAGIDPRMTMDASEIPRASPRAPVENKAEMQTQSESMKQDAKEGIIHKDWVDLDDVKEMRKNTTIREEL
jgi:tetratricopeptide (TPR) repeat protein